MRYTVRVYILSKNDSDGGVITNVLTTNDYELARLQETMMKIKYGEDNVWICDLVDEIMVG